ncbi:hypothetical protein BH20ACI2_BH20ACI2_17370 [soil metagenome]
MRKATHNQVYEFDDYRLDAGHLMLYRGGQAIHMAPKAIEVLMVLIDRRGEIISKDELFDAVWPDTIVEESNIFFYLSLIRKSLGNRSDGTPYIETLRRRGYRFNGDVRISTQESSPVNDVPTPPSGVDSDPAPAAKQRPESSTRTPWIFFVVVLAVAAAAGAFTLWRNHPQQVPPRAGQETRLMTAGGATRAAISQDGRYVAIAQNAALILFDLQDGDERILVPASADTRIALITFHPRTEHVYYGTRPTSTTHVTVYRISLTGGEAEKLFEDIYGYLAFSPDGTKMTFIRRFAELNEFALLTADSDGSNITKLASSSRPNHFEGTPAWSPDGRTIICPAISTDQGFHFTLAKISASDGSVEFVRHQRWNTVGSMVWLNGSRTVLMVARDAISINRQIWRLDTVSGETARVTDDAFSYESISGSADGRSIVAVKVRQSSHVWILGEQHAALTAGSDNHDGVGGLAWGPDGKVFYHSHGNKREAIWRMELDGSRATEIVPDTSGGFSVSPDGRFLVFQAKQSEDHLGLQIMDLTTGTQRALTQGVTAIAPTFYPDGKKVLFSIYDKKLALFEMGIDGGGPPRLLSDKFLAATSPAVSPSGRFIAFPFNRTETANIQAGIAIMDSGTRQVIASHPAKLTFGSQYEEPTIQWSSDESEIYFIQLDNTVSNIMKLSVTNGEIKRVTDFAYGRIFNFAREPGGTRFAVARGNVERDATLLHID